MYCFLWIASLLKFFLKRLHIPQHLVRAFWSAKSLEFLPKLHVKQDHQLPPGQVIYRQCFLWPINTQEKWGKEFHNTIDLTQKNMSTIAIRIGQKQDNERWTSLTTSSKYTFFIVKNTQHSYRIEPMTLPSTPYIRGQEEEMQSDHNTMSMLWDAKYTDDVVQFHIHVTEFSYLKGWVNYEYLPAKYSYQTRDD
jgi:hypothetical protein